MSSSDTVTPRPRAVPPESAGAGTPQVRDRAIGTILAELRHLTAEQVERIVAVQRERGVRFGEAAVSLGLVSADDVMHALAEQFHYPYAAEERRQRSAELVALTQPFSAQSESFRAIRSQLMMRMQTEEPAGARALAVISPDSGDGKSFFVGNLAVTLAQLGGRTLVVDADLRGPRQHEIFGVPNQSGLSLVLSGRVEENVIHPVDGVPGLFVLPVGAPPPNPLELLERPAFGLLLRELTNKFNHVIVDTPAAVYGADATVIAARCGSALMLARKDRSRLEGLQTLAASLAGTSTRVAGVIFNEF
ncbi:MAG: hypothetical protein RLY78_1933 [Pseudomonadota bacterium]|jgi:chain length determinant protein tyrosine kinase EpsG